MYRKLTTAAAVLLLIFSMSFTAAASSRWFYDGEAGKWKLVISKKSQNFVSEAVQSSGFEAIGAIPNLRTCLRKQWFQDPEDHYWYYLDKDGWMLTGVQELDGIRYRFRDRPHQGNYVPDVDGHGQTPIDGRGTGFYSYRANGRPTYGSLAEILGDTEPGSGGRGKESLGMWKIERDLEKDSAVQEMSPEAESFQKDQQIQKVQQLQNDQRLQEAQQPQKGQESTDTVLNHLTPRAEKCSASDLPNPEQKASASDIRSTEPNAENERRQELEEDERIHSHIDWDTDGHCIAYDRWSRILRHPLDYADCFENRCTSRIYLTGTDLSLPGEEMASKADAEENRDVRIPLYVSLLQSPMTSEGHLELVQAYAVDELFLPMQVGLESPDDTELRGNAGGIGESLPWILLNGGTYHWIDVDGEVRSKDYAGFRICSLEETGYQPLSMEETEQLGSQGFLAETRLATEGWRYLDWCDSGFDGSADDISFLTRTKGRFHFLSEQNLFGTAAASLPLPLDEDGFYPVAEDEWRSDVPYWLSSTPCSGMFVADRPELLDSLHIEMSGPVMGLDYAEAGRHYLLYDEEAALDGELFEDTARADRGISVTEAGERQYVRVRFRVKTEE